MAYRARYNPSSDSSSGEDYVPSDVEDRPRTSNEKTSCKRRRKQPTRGCKKVKALKLFRKAAALAYRPAAKRRRVETRGGTRTQVLPEETLLDVFSCEDRGTIECLQLTCDRFGRIVCSKMNGLCLRPIYSVYLSQTGLGAHAVVVPALRGNKRTKRVKSSVWGHVVYNAKSIELATEWIFAGLRCAQVCNSFELDDVALSNHFLTQLKAAAPTFNVSGILDLRSAVLPEDVTPATLVGAFPGLSGVRLDSEQHIDDALLRCFAEKGLSNSFPRATKRVKYDHISEKGIFDFCFGHSEQASGSVRDLKLRRPKVTKKFVTNLVMAHQSCGHNDPIRLEIADIPKQYLLLFYGFKWTTEDDGFFTAVLPGGSLLKVSYNADEDTWLIHRGFE
ncbi:hypothetical protein AAVH_11490 [Aphelenchoides avenae]|nr:hypothetical protein AAVH_11490 [Aphelenchus avenae]